MSDGEELIRDVWRRWNDGERDPDPQTFDPGIEIHSALAGNAFSGTAGLRRWIAEIDEQFDAWELSITTIRELEPERFIAHGAIGARGRQSGVDLAQPASWLIELRDRRVSGLHNFIGPDAEAAAEAEAAR